MHRPVREWQVGPHVLRLGERTWLMAVLNLTPDSFYAASRLPNLERVSAVAGEAIAAGADILDLGAESTRPGAEPVPPEIESERLIPAVEALRRHFPDTPLSVDTRRAETARAALAAGATIINDVSGLAAEGGAGAVKVGEAGVNPEALSMAAVIAQSGCGAVLMHLRGEFATMHRLPPLTDPMACVREGLAAILARARASGIRQRQIMLDPGFGFGKNLRENFPLLRHLADLDALGCPLLVGVSRKSFLGEVVGGKPPEERLFATVAAVTAAILAGAHLIRVHDVVACRDAARVADAILAAGGVG